MRIDEIASFATGLSVTPPASAGFSVPLLLVDSDDVPLYRRYIITTKNDFATDLTASSDQLNWATDLWGQDLNPAVAFIGRWAKAATSPEFICGTHQTTVATWAAVSDGDLRITDGSNNDDLTGLDFSAVTSVDDVCTVIQTALQAIGAPNITGLDTATCFVDALGKIAIRNSTTGAAAADISAVQLPAGAGTDISASGFLDVSNGFSVSGIDAEDPDDALAAIKALTGDLSNDPFICCIRSTPSIAQLNALAAALATYKMVGIFRVTDSDAKDSGATTDIGYLLTAAANKNAHLIYTEHTTQNPDAAIIGQVAPLPEGSCNYALKGISNCYQSGLDADGTTIKALSATERSALEAKGYDYLVKPSTSVHLVHGLTPGGVELRLRIFFYWLDKRLSEGAYAYLLGQDVVTFSDEDIQAIGGLFRALADTGVARKAIEDGYTLDLPQASEFTATLKATHTLSLTGMAEMIAQYAVNDISGTMSATV